MIRKKENDISNFKIGTPRSMEFDFGFEVWNSPRQLRVDTVFYCLNSVYEHFMSFIDFYTLIQWDASRDRIRSIFTAISCWLVVYELNSLSQQFDTDVFCSGNFNHAVKMIKYNFQTTCLSLLRLKTCTQKIQLLISLFKYSPFQLINGSIDKWAISFPNEVTYRMNL